MKELKFETSKGEFLVVDDVNDIGKNIPYDLVTKIGYIKNLTEEQASEVVESFTQEINNYTCHFNYVLNTHDITINSIESLHSLLESKGINLFENPYKQVNKEYFNKIHFEQSEQKTFYNPYIFKL